MEGVVTVGRGEVGENIVGEEEGGIVGEGAGELVGEDDRDTTVEEVQ